MADYCERMHSRRRKILDLTLQELWVTDKKNLRALFELLDQQGLSVGGYENRLTDALRYVQKAKVAIAAIES